MNLLFAAELTDESARRGVAAQRERREMQPSWPSLGPLGQHSKVRLTELDGRDRPDEQGCLGQREAQLAGPESRPSRPPPATAPAATADQSA